MMTRRDNYCLAMAGLAVAGTPTNGALKVTNITTILCEGQTYIKAATDNIAQALAPFSVLATLAAGAIGASKTICLWVFMKASDASIVVQPAELLGALNAPASITAAGYKPGIFEQPPERVGYALIGAIRVATNASGAYTGGTTALNAANQTTTYFNFGPDLGVGVPY